MYFCSHGQHDTAKILLTRGARFQADSYGKTPLETAVLGGYKEAVDVLLQHYPKLLHDVVMLSQNSRVKENMVSNGHNVLVHIGNNVLIHVEKW